MCDMIAAQMNQALPFTRHIGVSVTKIANGSGETELPQAPHTLNHVGSQHAGALFTLGETASGAAMTGAFAPVILNVVPLASGATIRYTKIAKGTVTASATTSEPGADLLARLEAEGVATFTVDVTLSDEAGDTVATMTVDWNVRKRS